MSAKSTIRITRQQALDTLLMDIPALSNDTLGTFMDALADSGESKITSQFDNFIVSDFKEER